MDPVHPHAAHTEHLLGARETLTGEANIKRVNGINEKGLVGVFMFAVIVIILSYLPPEYNAARCVNVMCFYNIASLRKAS